MRENRVVLRLDRSGVICFGPRPEDRRFLRLNTGLADQSLDVFDQSLQANKVT
jgi:hypothetical protein